MKLLPFGTGGRVLAFALGGALGMTPRKLFNVLRCEMDKWRRTSRPKSSPYVAILDITNHCNLSCPFCPTGTRRDNGRVTRFLDPSIVRQLADELGPYLISVNLYNWGEPLLHPGIADFIRVFRKKGVFTVLATNLSIPNTDVLEKICDAGLNYLSVSISGATQPVYEQYHRKGEIGRVLENLRLIKAYKKSARSIRPIIEIKYLLFKHNLHEVEAARRLTGEAGAQVFYTFVAGGAESAVLPEEAEADNPVRAGICHQLWQTMVITPDGGLAPCCFMYFKEDDFADRPNGALLSARNGELFQTARLLFDSSATHSLAKDLAHPCLKCELVHSQPHLREYLASNPNAVKGHRTGGP